MGMTLLVVGGACKRGMNGLMLCVQLWRGHGTCGFGWPELASSCYALVTDYYLLIKRSS
jgi:hypothetical protein